MAGDSGETLEQRRKALQDELAKQRELVALRLLPPPAVAAVAGSASSSVLGVSPAYPRSVTMRLAKEHPAVAVGLVTLGAVMLLRGRRDDLNNILSIARSVESLFAP